ncbi:hypothetical protein [Fodinicurvata sp. EGI_FJ10296]|uniref:hypothetical protein n=1 Tax=Fodinicurvata sp. EGI_FJ10296 TaxID=3231908 RepID=UPI003455E733
MVNNVEKPVIDEIRRVVQSELSDVFHLDVFVRGEYDHNGDPFLRVEFVFDPRNGPLNPQKVKSLGRHVGEALQDLNEDRFPVFSFKTLAEQTGETA